MMAVAGPLDQDPRNFAVVRAVAKVLDCTPDTVLRWVEAGILVRVLLTLRDPDLNELMRGAGAGDAHG